MSDGFKIPWETADDITLARLKYDYKVAKGQLDSWYAGGMWLHRDDIEHTSIIMFHLKAVIEYCGGSVE